MKTKYRETSGPGLLFELYPNRCKNTQFINVKCVKFHNINVSMLSNIFLFL